MRGAAGDGGAYWGWGSARWGPAGPAGPIGRIKAGGARRGDQHHPFNHRTELTTTTATVVTMTTTTAITGATTTAFHRNDNHHRHRHSNIATPQPVSNVNSQMSKSGWQKQKNGTHEFFL